MLEHYYYYYYYYEDKFIPKLFVIIMKINLYKIPPTF